MPRLEAGTQTRLMAFSPPQEASAIKKIPFEPYGIKGQDCLGNVEGWEVHMQVRIQIFEGGIRVG